MTTETAPLRDDVQAFADPPVVIVGYDGSPESRRAVEIAAERVGAGGIVVPVHVTAAAAPWLGTPYYDRAAEAIRMDGENLLRETHRLDTGLASVEPELLEGQPAEEIMRIARSRGAREIVVGSRGHGRLRALLGSVSHALLEHADRPVVIVPRGVVDEHR